MQWTHLIKRIKAEKAYIFGIPVPLHYVLLVLLIAVVFYGIRSWANQDNWETLVHEQYGFLVDYPSNWTYLTYGDSGSKNLLDLKAKISTNSVGFLGPISKRLGIYWVSMEDTTLEKAAEWGLDNLPPYSGTLSDLQETQIGEGNYPAVTRTFHYDNRSAMMIYYYVTRENGAYTLEFYLKDEDDIDEVAPVFNQILASFQILEW